LILRVTREACSSFPIGRSATVRSGFSHLRGSLVTSRVKNRCSGNTSPPLALCCKLPRTAEGLFSEQSSFLPNFLSLSSSFCSKIRLQNARSAARCPLSSCSSIRPPSVPIRSVTPQVFVTTTGVPLARASNSTGRNDSNATTRRARWRLNRPLAFDGYRGRKHDLVFDPLFFCQRSESLHIALTGPTMTRLTGEHYVLFALPNAMRRILTSLIL